MNDLWALIISFAFVSLVVGGAEIAHRVGRVPAYVTRKLVHVAVGTWVLPTLFLFDSWRWAIVPPIVSLIVNAVAMKRGSFRSIEGDDPKNFGPIFFPVSFILLLPLFWEDELKFAAGAGILCMAWGDPLASAVGRVLGTRRYTVVGSTKSFEGSIAMFAGSFAAAAIATYLLADFALPNLLLLAAGAAVVAAVVEAVSFWGADDLTVPLAVSAAAVTIAGRVL